MLELGRGVWAATLAQLRDHGQGRNECVVYWTAAQAQLGLVEGVVHPEHMATPWHYQPTQNWLNQFFADLLRERRSVVAQVHTHRMAAFHSPTDDKYPLVHVPGYLSLVVPGFAKGNPGTDELFLVEIDADGSWREVPVGERIAGFER